MIANILKKGDTIGIIAPSSPIIKEKIDDINKSIYLLEKSGFKIKSSKNFLNNEWGYSNTPLQKAEDINNMFENSEIKAILCATGGANSNSIFEYINYEFIRENPKIICGFSDSTSIINILHEKTGLVTFHGPTLKSLTSWETEYSYIELIKRFVENSLELGHGDTYKTIIPGVAEGELVGGNLSLISKLICGKYNINLEGKILFIEDLGVESPPEVVSSNLYYMKQNDVFKKISGIWVGNYEHESKVELERILLDTLGNEYNMPIIKSNNFGHTDRKTVIPIGTKARINTNSQNKIELIEKCLK